jgi:hypothetical protein
VRATCLVHTFILNLMVLILLRVQITAQSSACAIFSNLPWTSLSRVETFSSVPCPQTPLTDVTGQVLHPYKTTDEIRFLHRRRGRQTVLICVTASKCHFLTYPWLESFYLINFLFRGMEIKYLATSDAGITAAAARISRVVCNLTSWR